MRHLIRFFTLAIATELAGCGTIYVSNIKFSAVEICSEEYASRLHPNSGCLPPTRAENAQSFYLARFRLPVSPEEAASLTDSQGPPTNTKNHLPSMLGRIFQAVPELSQGTTLAWRAPATGNIEFIAVGAAIGAPHLQLATEVLVKTDLAGVVQKKLSAGVELNPAAIVDAALAASGIPAAAAPSGLREALVSRVIKAGYERYGFDAAKGGYYYVSMKPTVLDAVMSAFALCNWSIDQAPGRQKTSVSADSVGMLLSLMPDPVADCAGKLQNNASIAAPVKDLIRDIQATGRSRPDLKVVGMVIGTAIIHTEKGFSELCSKTDIGLIAQGKAGKLSTVDCDALRALVDQYKTGPIKPPAMPMQPGQNASTLTAEQASTLIISLSAEYARATFKFLEIHPHTSVLAIHWVPVQIAK